MRSRPWDFAATGASWSSTATRTGSTRSASRTARRWWQNSTGPGAGRMRPSARSMPSRPSSPRRRFPSSLRSSRDGATLALPPRVSLCRIPAPRGTLAGARHHGRAGVGGPLSGQDPCGRAQRPVPPPRAPRRRGARDRSLAISCSTAAGCPIISRRSTRRSPMRCSRRSGGEPATGGAPRSVASSATAIEATFSGPIRVRTSSISTTA